MKSFLQFSLIPLLLHALTTHAALTVTNIARGCEASFSLFLKSDGSLWAMGYDGYGGLGDGTDGTFNRTNRPEQIVSSGVTAIAVGNAHSLFLKSDGSLWAMGYNHYGQLGDGISETFNFTNRPERIVASGVTAIAAGNLHSLFLKSDGSLWGMGYNGDGELGDGVFNSTNRPEQIVTGGVTAVAAGESHSLFLKSNGSLWAMGDNRYGQLGDGTDGIFNLTNRPEQIVATGVTAIAAGANHSLFLKSNGSLWAMGLNDSGQLGDSTFNNTNRPEQIVANGVTTIAAGAYHSLFLKSDDSLWAMGANSDGQLGDGTTDSGNSSTNRPEQIVSGGVTAIAAGFYHSLFIKSDGSLWAMGWNSYGQLGDGFIEDTLASYGTSLPEQIFPLPQPVLSGALSSQTNLQINATCGFGGNFRLIGSTNIARPLSQWTPVRTNSITTRGTNNFSATLTNEVNQGVQKFFILQSQ